MFLDAIEEISKKSGRADDIIKEIIQGTSETYIVCKDVDVKSQRAEPFLDIHLPLCNSDDIA